MTDFNILYDDPLPFVSASYGINGTSCEKVQRPNICFFTTITPWSSNQTIEAIDRDIKFTITLIGDEPEYEDYESYEEYEEDESYARYGRTQRRKTVKSENSNENSLVCENYLFWMEQSGSSVGNMDLLWLD